MNADDFVTTVRKGSDKLRVDDVVVNTGKGEAHGKGMLHISREKIALIVTLDPGQMLPEVTSGAYTKRDCWKLAGILEDELRFGCDVAPADYSERSWPSGFTKYRFNVNPICLVPSGIDAMSSRERSALFRQIEGQDSSGTGGQQTEQAAPSEEAAADASVHFDAMLFEYPSLHEVLGAQIKGELGGFDLTLAQDKADKDLHVSLRSRKEYLSSGVEEDWKMFRAVMNAIAFVHGAHAWPYRIEYWRAGRKITDQVTSAHRLPRTSHAPFDERLAFNAKIGKVEWDYLDVLRKAAAFFSSGSTLSSEVGSILFLFREADDGSHSEITTIALCVLFENLVRVLFRELKLEEGSRREDLALLAFEQARSRVLELITKNEDDGYLRVRKVLRSAALFSQKEMLQALARHFGMEWETDLETVFKTWQLVRNPLVHDSSRAQRTEDQWKELLLSESRIAGAINVLLLKLFGYSGLMQSSAFEGRYRTLKKVS